MQQNPAGFILPEIGLLQSRNIDQNLMLS